MTVEPGRPSQEWALSRAGEAEAAALAGATSWRRLAAVVTSPEPKARATARPIAVAAGLEPLADPRLREVERGESWADGADAYREAVAEYFATGARAGWEPAAAVHERMIAALTGARANAGGDLCAVSHGLALSLYVAALRGDTPDFDAWAAMPLPAVAVIRGASATPFVSVERFFSGQPD